MVLLYEMKIEVTTVMKFSSLLRHLREGFKNVFRNGWMTVASVGAVTVTLILVSAFLALMLNLNATANKIESDVEVKVLIDLSAKEKEIEELGDSIRAINEVDYIVFKSKDEELDSLADSLGEYGDVYRSYSDDNPLSHAYVVKAKEPENTEGVAAKIETFDHVEQVNFGEDFVPALFKFNKYARTIGLVLIIALVLTAIFLISNTIRVTIMARSTEIGIMKLVGATNGFIRGPFFIEGLLLGVLGSIIPIVGILIGYHFLDENIQIAKLQYQFVDLLPFSPFAWQLSAIVLVIGSFIGVWGSVMSVRKFLKV